MASPEEVIEPLAQSSTAQNLNQRHFLYDLHNLSPDELDSLMSSSGKNLYHLCMKQNKLAVETLTYVACMCHWSALSWHTDGRPFLVVHHLPELKEHGVPYLIPGVPITCKVDNTEKYTTRSKVTMIIIIILLLIIQMIIITIIMINSCHLWVIKVLITFVWKCRCVISVGIFYRIMWYINIYTLL